MSEKEDKTRPTPTSNNIEDIDIYSDILSDRPESVVKLRQRVEKLTSEKTLLLKSLNSLQETYEQMLKKFKELDVKYKTICYNSSSLFKTAKCEIARKDRIIQELRRERDNLVFRKTTVLGRARKILRTPTKSRLTFKKTEPDEKDSLQKTSLAEGCDEEEENSLLSLGTKNSEEDKSEDIECNVVGNHDKNDGLISSSAKTNFNTLPPLLGPLTEYTKRMYKKSYGVSPPKSPSITDYSCKIKQNTISDKLNAGSTLSTEIVEEGNCGDSPKQEVVASAVTSKLQNQVKEFIKLGSKPTVSTPTVKSTFSPTTKSPKNQNNKILDLGSKEVLKETQPTLILQCDLRTPKNTDKNQKQFVNTVSINETIDNIIRNQKAGLYNQKQSIELKGAKADAEIPLEIISLANTSSKTAKIIPSENCNNLKNIRGNQFPTPKTKTLETTRPNRLVAGLNKRVTSNKPAISPVTFGKLVAPNSGVPAVSSDSVHCRETESRKNRVLTALFGESPMKPNLNMDDELDEMSPSPTTQYDGQILPSSPSLDSDNPEDLVIDTTAGSRNTSPRLSESSHKDEGERMEVIQPKLPETCSDNGPGEQSLNERGVSACPNVEGKINMERHNCGHNEATENSSKKNKVLLHSDNDELQILNKRLPESDKVAKRGESCLPDLSECLSLNVNPLSPNFTEKRAAIGNISPHISCTPERKTISQELYIKPTNVYPQKPNAQMNRFIPSPPQLTLVSAFKHSENSVFSIAEDTMGFVSALTRIRDISPLRTPNKKKKSISTETHQSQGQDCDHLSGTEVGLEEKQVKSTLSLTPITPNDVGSNENNTDEAMAITCQTAKGSEGMNCESVEKERKPLTSITNPNIDPSEQSKHENLNSNKSEPESSSYSRENLGVDGKESVLDKTNKSVHVGVGGKESVLDKTKKSVHVGVDGQGRGLDKTKKPPLVTNEFKRARPVRRIIPILNKPEITNKITKESVCIKSVEINTSVIAKVQCSGASRKPTTIGLENVVNSTADLQPNEQTLGTADELDVKQDNIISIGNKRKPNRKCVDELNPTIKNQNLNDSEKSKPYINTNHIKTTQQSPNNLKNLIFKRSVSLRMMPKPVAKVDYDILSNNKIEISKKVIRKSVQITSQETEKKELEQIPHIASINKKRRISNYQGNVEKTKPQESTCKAVIVLEMSKEPINKEDETKDQIVSPPASDRQIPATELHPKRRRSTGPKSELVQQSKGILQDSPNLSEPLKINKNPKENLDETLLSPKKVLQSNCPKKTQRSKSSHCMKRSQSRSPDPTVYHSRKSQNRSPDASYRPTSHHRSRKSCEESTDPRFRSKSQHRLRRSPSLSPEGNHPKSIHCSRRSRSRSPQPCNRTKSHNRPRRSHSRSPGYYYRNKFYQRPRRSRSRSPDYRHLKKSYHSRKYNSRSPESRDVRKPISTFKSRSPCKILPHGQHIKRLRSRSPSPNELRNNSVHYYSRRSNSSPHRSRRKVERSQSPYAKGSSFNNRKDETSKHAFTNEQNQSSPVQDSEELVRLRKELEIMKNKLKDSELAANNSSTGQEKPSDKSSSIQIAVDKNLDSPNDKLQTVKDILLDCTVSEEQAAFINETNETSVRIASERCKRTSSTSIKEMVTSSLQTDNGEGEGVTSPPRESEPNKQSGQEVIKVIRLTRRRVGHLGDSDVNVVSSTSKFSSRTKVVTP